MTRYGRFAFVFLLSLAIASTGICSSLSTGTESACAVAPLDQDSCCEGGSGEEPCPETPERPTCRPCDGTVAFLLKDKTGDNDAPRASIDQVATFASRPPAGAWAMTSRHLLALSASPPIHLLNAVFRN